MEDILIRQGETLELSVVSDDLTATTVRLIAKANASPTPIIDETANFATAEGKRIATIKTNDTNHTEGDYEYMLTIVNAAGDIDKLPDISECDGGDCTLPTLTICEAIDLGVS